MGKKRKSEYAGLEEVEKTMYSTFSTAANAISQLYSQSINQQRRAYNAGSRASTVRPCLGSGQSMLTSEHIPATAC